MTKKFNKLKQDLRSAPKIWLVTGVAGFIGSNLLEALLALDQKTIGLDNFSTGYRHNLEEVRQSVTAKQWQRFDFIEGDIRDLGTCRNACANVDYVLHHAALGSVPRSIEDPILTHQSNVDGFLHMLVAARDAKVKRFVYAASSSTYGDNEDLPKVEDKIGRPLSPYAASKYFNELYADVFARTYGMETIGLRYFNIFGPRQDPKGAYAAVIPLWFSGLIKDETVYINGDGETSRDFCFIDNCIQANLLAACAEDQAAVNQVYNVAFGERTSLNSLFEFIRDRVAQKWPHVQKTVPHHRDFRAGDVRHSLADISKSRRLLGYNPKYSVIDGLKKAAKWYMESFK